MENTILDDCLTLSEIADQFNVTVRTIERYMNLPNGLPAVRIGRRTYFKRASVKAWIAGREVTRNQRRSG